MLGRRDYCNQGPPRVCSTPLPCMAHPGDKLPLNLLYEIVPKNSPSLSFSRCDKRHRPKANVPPKFPCYQERRNTPFALPKSFKENQSITETTDIVPADEVINVINNTPRYSLRLPSRQFQPKCDSHRVTIAIPFKKENQFHPLKQRNCKELPKELKDWLPEYEKIVTTNRTTTINNEEYKRITQHFDRLQKLNTLPTPKKGPGGFVKASKILFLTKSKQASKPRILYKNNSKNKNVKSKSLNSRSPLYTKSSQLPKTNPATLGYTDAIGGFWTNFKYKISLKEHKNFNSVREKAIDILLHVTVKEYERLRQKSAPFTEEEVSKILRIGNLLALKKRLQCGQYNEFNYLLI